MGHSSTDYESTDKDNYDVNLGNVRKCIRKGDTIYYSKPENITMIKSLEKIANVSTTLSSTETAPKDEKVLSGESLYKAFTFEQSTNDEETEKCIAFWKSVIEKNLAPIKCSIIENKRKKTPSNGTSNQQTKIDGEVETNSRNFEKEEIHLENEIKKIHEHYRTMWRNILNDLQKKRINEIKLIGQSRCKFCESVTPNYNELDDKKDKEETIKEIRQLNKWKSPGWKQRIGALSIKSTDTTEKIKVNTPDQTSWAELAKKESPPNFKFKNVMEEKKEKGIYSEWRYNKVKEQCLCGFATTCNCNKNPAIETVTTEVIAEYPSVSSPVPLPETGQEPTTHRRRFSSPLLIKKKSSSTETGCTCSDPTCTYNRTEILLKKGEESSSFPDARRSNSTSYKQLKIVDKPITIDNITRHPSVSSPAKTGPEVPTGRKRFSSILKINPENVPVKSNCVCSSPVCRCAQMKSKTPTEHPSPRTKRTSSIKRNSLEIIRRRLSFQPTEELNETKTEETIVEANVPAAKTKSKSQDSFEVIFTHRPSAFGSVSDQTNRSKVSFQV